VFTGLIEDVGTVRAVREGPSGGRVLEIEAGFDPGRIGDSIAIGGVCLTATAIDGRRFTIDAGPETLARTTIGALKTGTRVNLERALALGARLGGHLVQGHVDGIGKLRSVVAHDNAYDLTIDAPAELLPLIAARGAIAVDGISLTVTGVDRTGFSVMIIPHTWKATTLAERRAGSEVNLECDLFARYVARILEHRDQGGGITKEFLEEHGF
jgi:riboflavin synthase